MKRIGWAAAALVLATSPLYALVGVGGHWAPGFGTKMSGAKSDATLSIAGNEVSGAFVREKAEIEQGFGFKVWLDLPVIPINLELTTNFQAGFYGASLEYVDPISAADLKLPLELDMGVPLIGKAEPAFGLVRTDLTIAWRPLDLNLLLIRLQGYVGGGPTWNYATRPLTAEIAEEAVETLLSAGKNPESDGKELQKALEKAYGDPDSGFGGHAMIGVRATVLFVSAYVNGKYYFGGLPKGLDSGLTLEVGGGIGF